MSGEISREIDPTDAYAIDYTNTYPFYYVDDLERRWVYTSYYMSSKGWFCIDDPENSEIPKKEEISQRDEIVWYEAKAPNVTKQFLKEIFVVGALVLILVIATLALIHRVYKNKIE